MLFHIDPNIDSHKDVKELAEILENQTDPVGTAYGWTSGGEVAKLILKEGLDTIEFKNRILRYKGRRHLTEKKKNSNLKDNISDYLSKYCQRSKTYDGL